VVISCSKVKRFNKTLIAIEDRPLHYLEMCGTGYPAMCHTAEKNENLRYTHITAKTIKHTGPLWNSVITTRKSFNLTFEFNSPEDQTKKLSVGVSY
jgi:hypothetical protein